MKILYFYEFNFDSLSTFILFDSLFTQYQNLFPNELPLEGAFL